MIERIKISLFYPSQIGKYAYDSIWRIFVFMILCATICTMPTVIQTVKTNGLKDTSKEQIKYGIYENQDKIPNLKIEDSKLVGEGSCVFNIDIYGVTINDNKVFGMVNVVFQEDNVLLALSTIPFVSYTYDELNLEGFDFTSITKNNSFENYIGFEKIFSATDYVIRDLKPFWATSLIISEFILQVLFYSMLTVLMAFVFKMMSPILSYGEVFKVVAYGLIASELGMLFSKLFNFDIFLYVCPIISIIFITRAIKVLEFNKMIIKNLIKK